MLGTNVRPISLALVLVLFAASAGCLGGNEGRVTVYVKDAPTDDFREINVVFTRVQVHQGSEAAEDEGGWITVFEDEAGARVDLLAYRAEDARAFLGDESLEAGTYNQVVIDVASATGVTTDGREVPFEVSSGRLRLVEAFQVEADETTRVVLDFDLDRPGTIVKTGPTGYRFTPVVGRVIVEQGVADEGGSTTGSAT